jgi:hypothetical protein
LRHGGFRDEADTLSVSTYRACIEQFRNPASAQ